MSVLSLDSLHIRIVQGAGSVSGTGEAVVTCGGERPLVVTDPGVENAGHADLVVESLKAAGLRPAVFSDVHENPTTIDAGRCVEAARAHEADLLIGLGGGSSMDTAKACNFLLTNGGKMQDYRGQETAPKAMLPFIAIPTTAGTGSECQRYALISDPESQQKMACGDPKALAKVAILDPLLTLTQPAWVTACTGIDALSHSIETAVTTARSKISAQYSREAFALLARHLPTLVDGPDNLEAREAVQQGAALAGAAIEFSMLGAAHAAANPLTAHYGIVHGQAVGVMLPAVVRWNGQDSQVEGEYAQLLKAGDIPCEGTAAAEILVCCIESLLRKFQFKTRLGEFGIHAAALPMLSREASEQWTAGFNPRQVSEGEFLKLYNEVL
jgi:alcohol dehydrogenase